MSSRTDTLRRYAIGVALALAFSLTLSGCEGDEAPASAPDAGANAPAAQAIATLRGLKGGVRLERAGQMRTAKDEPLFAKDAVETGADGEAVIAFSDGRTVELGPDARLVLNEDQTGLLLEVQRGLVLSRVPAARPGSSPAGEVAIRILTPFGLTRVGDGESQVSVSVGEDSARVDVTIGAVELVSVNGETTTKAAAGDSVSLSAGKVEVLGREEITTLETIEVTVRADGRAELRRAGEKKWSAVGEQGAVVHEGDAVRVRRGRSTLALAGSSTAVTLERGGEVVFEKSIRDGGREESQLELKRGAVALALARDRKTRVVLGGMQLESDVGGFFTVERTRNGFEVSAITGDLLVKKGERAQALKAGQLAKVSARGTEVGAVAMRTRPVLVLPSKNGLKVFHPGLAEAILDWRGEDGDYDVRVAEDSGFERLVAAGRVHQSEVAVPIPRRGRLYWDAREAEGGTVVDSGSAVFAPEPRMKELDDVRNTVPDGNEKTTIYYQDKPPAVTFTWAKESGAAKYKVAVFRQGQLGTPIAERTASDVRAPLEAGVLSEGRYVWSVTPLTGAGAPLHGGRMNKLELVYDNSVPSLLIQSPRNGERVSRSVRTRGVAPVGTRLFINGRPAALDEKNRFDLAVTASASPPALVYRVAKPNAADAFYVRALRRSSR